MVRMGLRFMPPMQELLHIKLSRIVVISEPNWNQKWDNIKSLLSVKTDFGVGLYIHQERKQTPQKNWTGQSYLWRLVGNSHTLPFGVGIFKILGKLTAFNSNQMASMFHGWKEEILVEIKFITFIILKLPNHFQINYTQMFSLLSAFWWCGHRLTTSATCSVFL